MNNLLESMLIPAQKIVLDFCVGFFMKKRYFPIIFVLSFSLLLASLFFYMNSRLDFSADEILSSLRHDKKAKGDGVNVVFVNEIGSFEFKFLTFKDLEILVKEAYSK